MNIHLVRRKFQVLGNITVSTDTNIDLSHLPYSLQQESLNSEKMLLYITTSVDLQLEGHLLIIKDQKWIVYQAMKETVNNQLYEYLLLPATDNLTIKFVSIEENALGLIETNQPTTETTVSCYVGDRGIKERGSLPPVETIQQVFFVANKEMPNTSIPYEIYYFGKKYKINSTERVVGVIKFRLTEDK